MRSTKMRLIYLSPVPLSSFAQRPHELVKFFHEHTGGDVLWIDPYPARLPTAKEILHIGRHEKPAMTNNHERHPSWITLVQPRAAPIEPIPLLRNANRFFWNDIFRRIRQFADTDTILGIGKPSLFASHLISSMRYRLSFYDAMDDFPAFYNGISRASMQRYERTIVRACDVVLASSTYLHERLQSAAADVRMVKNACATERLPAAHFNREREISVVGYIGTIAAWFDWELVNALALVRPDVKFRIIGPLYVAPKIKLAANIAIEPPLSHDRALIEMANFDVGLIPFLQTELTKSVDPIKYYEYKAMGLPIISSAFGEMALRESEDGIFLVDRSAECAALIEKALAWQSAAADIAQFQAQNSWAKRFDDMGLFKR